ncbi:hypothetical protein DVH24_009231 [Malus domestica]|uniref:Uncharacterized protein n=1 Tax=Malus domestica TaxID=3750 RepID=A0A498IKC0_MALDO|nr:hypothetical protein DVH24_009231 [Malus domestica]
MSLWRNQLLNHLTAELVEIRGNRGKGKVYIRCKGWVWIRCPAAMPDSGRDGIGSSDLKEVVAIGNIQIGVGIVLVQVSAAQDRRKLGRVDVEKMMVWNFGK